MPVKLNYQIYGEGKPFYLLHGLFGSNRNWFSIARQLAGIGQLVAVDLRNHGDSGHAVTMGYIEMANDVAELAASLNHHAINLLGHSMGGKTAMTAALLYPELLDKLIVVDIAPVVYNPKHDQLITALEALPVARLNNRTEASDLLAQDIKDPILRQFLLQNLVRNEQSGFRWRINLDAIHSNYEKLRSFPPELINKQFGGAGLFLTGSQSKYVLPEHHDAIATHFPEAKIVSIDGAGHWVHADKPDVLASEVRRFLMAD